MFGKKIKKFKYKKKWKGSQQQIQTNRSFSEYMRTEEGDTEAQKSASECINTYTNTHARVKEKKLRRVERIAWLFLRLAFCARNRIAKSRKQTLLLGNQ